MKLLIIAAMGAVFACHAQIATAGPGPDQDSQATATEASDYGTIQTRYTALEHIGDEIGVMRRDPSDVIKVDDLYYIWYSKGLISPGYDATVWYATSPDGLNWTEQGQALSKGEPGAWDGASVFTPNILVAEDKYWLFFTGTSRDYHVKPFNPDSKIGIAVSDSPDGPWEKLESNPALTNGSDRDDFDSHLVDDACLIVRDGQYWCYYKGRPLGRSPHHTKMGLAIADRPQGPYIKYEGNPVIPGSHEVMVWPQGQGVAAMINNVGPKAITFSILYAEDGINFTKTHDVPDVPPAGGSYRPAAFTDDGTGQQIQWGVCMGRDKQRQGSMQHIRRFDLQEVEPGHAPANQ